MDRNLALEFVRVTEAGAIAAARWFGKGDKNKADGAAVDAMRSRFNVVDFSGEVVIGEGDKDEAPLLYIGEKIGSGTGPEVDIAVDPLECTTNCAEGKPDAISVLAAGPKGSLLKAPGTYMLQLVVGPNAKGVIDITKPIEENIKNVAVAIKKPLEEVTVAMLKRPRHDEYVKKIRQLGCRVWLHDHGSVGSGLATCLKDSPIDVMFGIAGAPEAVITAAGVKCFGGDIQGILKPHNEEFKQQALGMGITDLNKVFTMEDLAAGEDVMFVATGVSSGPLLDGVIFGSDHLLTHSIVIRAKTGTSRFLRTTHKN